MKNLPQIAMGAWAWGDTDGYFGNTMTGEDFRPIFDAAVKAGLNLWDTATAYSNGESEKILGRLVNDAGREKIIVSTKFTPQIEVITAELKKIAEAHGVSAAQVATAYAVNKGVLPILGVTKMYQVEEAVKTAGIALAAEEMASLEAAADRSGASSIQFWESKME